MTTQNAGAYGRNFDGKPGDVLERLKSILANTPPHSLSTVPLRRALLEATVAELERLRQLERSSGGGAQ